MMKAMMTLVFFLLIFNLFRSRDIQHLVVRRGESSDGAGTPARTCCDGRRRRGASGGSWDRSITSIGRGSAVWEASREEIVGIGPKVVKFRRSDWSVVALVVELSVVGALWSRNTGGVVASSDWLGVCLAVQSGKHVIVVDHGSRVVLNLERGHAILGSQFLDSSDD